MTGHGQASVERHELAVQVELRSVNNRYFKLHLRAPEGYGWLEPRVESVLRPFILRGSIQATLLWTSPRLQWTHAVNVDLLSYYATELRRLAAALQLEPGGTVVDLMQLPGAIQETPGSREDDAQIWPAVEAAVRQAVENLDQMRCAEGRAMAADFRNHLAALTQYAQQIRHQAPAVQQDYQLRLTNRLAQLSTASTAAIEPADLARELALLADRCDISEELVRLESHIRQFRDVAESESPAGKKLEFILQEMLRETNTIGSKASDLTIARQVIEVKTIIERMREMVQNVE
jgi:uncharacterized protein (TIGR00255 family)